MEIAKAYAQQFKHDKIGALEPISRKRIFTVLFVSADIIDHSTAALMSGELGEMAKIPNAMVYIPCVANPSRLKQLGSVSPFHILLKNKYGSRFFAY